jgi:hypothetical protein
MFVKTWRRPLQFSQDIIPGTIIIVLIHIGNYVKQACATILVLLYMFASIGAIIHQHFCMGELVNFSMFISKDKKCGKCGMEKHTDANNECCKDIPVVIKGEDSHTFSQAAYNLPAFTFNTTSNEFCNGAFLLELQTGDINNILSLPPLIKKPLFLQFRNIRI